MSPTSLEYGWEVGGGGGVGLEGGLSGGGWVGRVGCDTGLM